MKVFHFIHVAFAGAFYRWAMREIDPLHPDVPRIILQQRKIADKAQGLFS